jgi:putative ABC transport system permease protein
VLVVFQFTVSVMLIIGTFVIYRQIQFAKSRPVGYSRDGLMMFQKAAADFQGKHDVLRFELKNTGVVEEMAESASAVTDVNAINGGFSWKGKEPGNDVNFATLGVTHEYGKTIGWQFVAGRDFSKEFVSDSTGFIINEAAAKLMGLKNPVGETVKWETDFYDGGNFKIVGVVKDMVMTSPFEPVKPTIFFLQGYKNWVLVKINPTVSVAQALPKIEAVFKKVVPTAPFDYKFASDEYAVKFASEERTGTLATFFAVLAVVISCLGLFGLASFMAEQRIKEIGVRKVLGASVLNLWGLLSKDFVTLVVISLFIAMPLAYYFMGNWLQHYEYRSNMPWWIFASTGLGAIVVTILTVSYQSIKAALMNPAKAIRTE